MMMDQKNDDNNLLKNNEGEEKLTGQKSVDAKGSFFYSLLDQVQTYAGKVTKTR